jgi:AcrR family transcriptional regulator
MKTKRILECTFNELATCGFKHVSVDNIAAKMHISKKTIYDMFENKEKLLLYSIKHKIGKIIEGFSPSLEMGNNVLGTIIYNAVHLYKFFNSLSPQFWQEKGAYPLVEEYLNEFKEQLLQLGRKRFDQVKGEGYLRSDADFAIIGRLLESQVMVMKEEVGCRQSDLSICFSCLVIIFRGVCTDRGIELLDNMVNAGFEMEVVE